MQRINIVSIQMVKEKSLKVYSKKISCPSDAADILRTLLEDKDREYLIVLTLNTKNIVTSINTVSVGSLNSSIVHPREVFKTAILANAASIIIGHNHPSGNTLESQEDVNISLRLKECGKILGIELLDHIIIGEDSQYLSLKEKGIL